MMTQCSPLSLSLTDRSFFPGESKKYRKGGIDSKLITTVYLTFTKSELTIYLNNIYKENFKIG